VDLKQTGRCCPPLLGTPLDAEGAGELARAFKALADPVRVQLLSLIAASPDGCACSCDLEAPVAKSQPTVSHHLSLLADAGLITKHKQGRWVMCSIVPQRLAALRDALAPEPTGDSRD
jgi:ArsR family transcriptional regulator